MTTASSSESKAFLDFLRAQIDAGHGDRPPEELLHEWRSRQRSETMRAPSGESAYDVLLREGFLGCIDTGTGDLSTNPAHMEEFGEA